VEEELAQSMFGRLRDLMSIAISEARAVAGEDPAWDAPRAASCAGIELADQEVRRPDPQAGSWPWAGAPMTAHWALWAMTEQATALPALLTSWASSYAADVVARAVLEACRQSLTPRPSRRAWCHIPGRTQWPAQLIDAPSAQAQALQMMRSPSLVAGSMTLGIPQARERST